MQVHSPGDESLSPRGAPGGSLLPPLNWLDQPCRPDKTGQCRVGGNSALYNCLQQSECLATDGLFQGSGKVGLLTVIQSQVGWVGLLAAAALHSCLCTCNLHPTSLSYFLPDDRLPPDSLTIPGFPIVMILIALFNFKRIIIIIYNSEISSAIWQMRKLDEK